MKFLWRKSNGESRKPKAAARKCFGSRLSTFDLRRAAFTLIELVLVLALLVIITSLALPPMAKFMHGRALGNEAQQMLALMHAAQSRAVSEGMPMMFWIDALHGEYGVAAETSGPDGDPQAENLKLDDTLKMAVVSSGAGAPPTFKNLPAIKFLPDGTVAENSPQTVQLTDADGFGRRLVEARNHLGYEIDADHH